MNKTAAPPDKLSPELLLKAGHILSPAWGKMQEVPATTFEVFVLMTKTAGTQERMANGSGEETAAAGKQSDAEGDAEAPGSTSAPKTPLACPNTVQPQTERVGEAAAEAE